MKRILFLLAFTAITTFAFSQAKIYDGQTIKARAALIVGGKTITDIVDDTVMANKYESRLMSEWSIKTLFETFNGGSATIDTFSITTRNRDKKGLDSISQVMANNYTPTSRTITINGTTYDLSSNRTWSVGDAKLASTQTWTGVNTFNANITATNAFFNDYIYSGNNSNGRMYVGTYFNNATKSQVANNFVKQNINYYGFTQDTAGNVNIGAKSFVVNTDITASSFIKSGGTSSQFLKADGTTDNNSYSLTSHNHTLDALSNVTITSNTNGEILMWNGTNWLNRTLSEAGIASVSSLGNYVSKWESWKEIFYLENVSINYLTKFSLPDNDDAAATNDNVEVKMPYWNGRMSVENYTFFDDGTYEIKVDDNIIFAENGANLTLPDISTVPVGKTYEFGIKNVSTWGEQYTVNCYEGDVLDVPINTNKFYVKTIDTSTWTDKGFVSTKIVKGDNNKWLILQIQNPNY